MSTRVPLSWKRGEASVQCRYVSTRYVRTCVGERERKKERVHVCVCVCEHICVCSCSRERMRKRLCICLVCVCVSVWIRILKWQWWYIYGIPSSSSILLFFPSSSLTTLSSFLSIFSFDHLILPSRLSLYTVYYIQSFLSIYLHFFLSPLPFFLHPFLFYFTFSHLLLLLTWK